MSKQDKRKLSSDDWEALLGTRQVTVGKLTLNVPPLSLENIARVIEAFQDTFKDGVPKGAGPFSPEVLYKLIPKFPGLISDIIGLDEDDTKRLPASIILQVLEKIVENEKDLIKNLGSLTEAVTRMTVGVQAETEDTKIKGTKGSA